MVWRAWWEIIRVGRRASSIVGRGARGEGGWGIVVVVGRRGAREARWLLLLLSVEVGWRLR